jgi:hypothetical protein
MHAFSIFYQLTLKSLRFQMLASWELAGSLSSDKLQQNLASNSLLASRTKCAVSFASLARTKAGTLHCSHAACSRENTVLPMGAEGGDGVLSTVPRSRYCWTLVPCWISNFGCVRLPTVHKAKDRTVPGIVLSLPRLPFPPLSSPCLSPLPCPRLPCPLPSLLCFPSAMTSSHAELERRVTAYLDTAMQQLSRTCFYTTSLKSILRTVSS